MSRSRVVISGLLLAIVLAALFILPTRLADGTAQVPANPNTLWPRETVLVDGVYTGDADYHYEDKAMRLAVEIRVSDGRLSAIELVESEGDIFTTAAAEMLPGMLEAQSHRVDTVSGATITSAALSRAVERALEQARADDASRTSTPE